MTDCKNCVFLKGNSCLLGKYDKWIPDENFNIKERCPTQRNEKWLGSTSLEEAEIKVRSEVLYRTHVFIYCENWSIKAINSSIKALNNQLLKPSGITLIGTKETFKQSIFKKFSKKCSKIIVCIDNNYNRYNCLDAAINTCSAPFYLLINEGFLLPPPFIANIDCEINDKLNKFSYISNNYQGFVYGCSTILHKVLGGNMAGYFKVSDDAPEILFADDSLEPKVKYLCSLDNSWDYIRSYESFLYDD